MNSEIERLIAHERERLMREIETWCARIRGDLQLYHHLFLHGEFWVDVRVFQGLLAWGGEYGMVLALFLYLVENQAVQNAAIYQILAHPIPRKA